MSGSRSSEPSSPEPPSPDPPSSDPGGAAVDRADTGDSTRVERSAGGVVVRRRENAPHVLLILDPYGRWSLPKGHVEEGETLRETATREVREETGLEELEVGPRLGTVDWYFQRRNDRIHKFCTYFLMRSAVGDARPATDEGIFRCAWVRLEAASDEVEYEAARDVVERARRALGADDPPFVL